MANMEHSKDARNCSLSSQSRAVAGHRNADDISDVKCIRLQRQLLTTYLTKDFLAGFTFLYSAKMH